VVECAFASPCVELKLISCIATVRKDDSLIVYLDCLAESISSIEIAICYTLWRTGMV
jgi:hypothetical protein